MLQNAIGIPSISSLHALSILIFTPLLYLQLAALTGKKRPADKRKLDNAAVKSEATVSKNEDSAEFEKAKIMLEAKARLYDKMSRGEVEG